MKTIDITTGHVLEVSSSALATQLYEVARRMEVARDEYLDRIKSEISSIEEAVLLMVSFGAGLAMAGKNALIQDCLNRAVDLSTKSAKLYTISNNLKMSQEHLVRMTVEQASEFGL